MRVSLMNIGQPMRKKIIEELMKEVKGPRYGANETISFNPWDEYLSGIVIPQSWRNNFEDGKTPDNENIIEIDEGISEDSSMDEEIINNFTSHELDPSSFIKSFGVSFTLDNPNPTFNICATWGRYFENKNAEHAFDLTGTRIDTRNEDIIWERFSFGEIIEIDINDAKIYDESIEKYDKKKNELILIKKLTNCESEKEINESDDGFVKIYIKRLKVSDELYTYSIYLINDLKYVQKKEDYHADVEKCLFQPSLRINSNKEIKSPKIEMINESEEELEFLYKDKPMIASGHMCSAVWKDIDFMDKINTEQLWPDYEIRLKNNEKYKEFLNPDIRTEFTPLYPVTLPKFDLDENENDFNAEELSNKSPEEIFSTLIKLPELYESWIKSNEEKVIEDKYKDTANRLIKNEKKALKRIKNGIKLIKDNDIVYTAFCFANKTMALQNSWGKDENTIFKWRPFQIAFFLMNIQDIYEDNTNKEILDLLWIPTGGGKTEAYLGIIAYTIALRRLKAYENHETGAGTSIISRYTLRLLTVQQFRRTLKMITAAEYLRVDKTGNNIGWRPRYSKITGDWIYGSTRFSTGLWVGGGVTPNHLLNDGGAMDILQEKSNETKFSQGEPAQILKCPVCGSWLSVPETGLNDKINNIHVVINHGNMNEEILNEILAEIFNKKERIHLKGTSSNKHKEGFYTLSFEIEGKISRKEFEDEILTPIQENDISIASLGRFNIGYFTSLKSIKKVRVDAKGKFDFEIWCTNPKCKLNNTEWHEGHPYPKKSEPEFPDGNYERNILSPFENNTRIPIPAYIIDDHVYNRCPTVVISTVDKIARLSFEPKAGAIFGNVNYYNKYYGYNRDGMYPKKGISAKNFDKSIKPLKTPDLIIQDELHLIEGPLGSLFGLYETIVSAMIKKHGGNPKYIASTATISKAKKQVDLLFSKELFQFPPHGLNISDNFFVEDYEYEDAWDEKQPGRLYFGVYAPGKGPMTPQVRLWGKMLKTPNDNSDDENLKNFWTIVGYYNSIKELGGSLALYRDDIKNRLKTISKDNIRQLNEDDKEELSSRISSIELPMILDNLERDGLGDKPKFDAIFTTSMFGTGVDISHLSLMIMTSQPKTTGAYIQATGRIGRRYGGLIVNFFKAGRARDLNHYEMFSSFHSRIYLGVEPVSVSPFSEGCLTRGLGPALVAFLRNSSGLNVNWINNDGKTPIQNKDAEKDIKIIKNYIEERLTNIENIDDENIDHIKDALKKSIKRWKDIANIIENKRLLKMYEYYYDKPQQNVVLGDSGHEHNKKLRVVYKNAPQSLRDVEETIEFWV